MSKTERDHPASEFGTDIQFLDWTSHQPSVIDGNFNQFDPDRNIACHVRRLKFGAGRGIKPPFSAVAMTDIQHKLQESQNGELRVLRKYKFMIVTVDEAAKWFEEKAAEELERWIEYRKALRHV